MALSPRDIRYRRRLLRDAPDPADYVSPDGTDLLGWLGAIEAWGQEILKAWHGHWPEDGHVPMEARFGFEWLQSISAIRQIRQRIIETGEARITDIEQIALLSAELMSLMEFGFKTMGKTAQQIRRKGGKGKAIPAKANALSQDIAELAAKNRTQGQIAQRLGVSLATVKRHLRRLKSHTDA